MHSVTSYPGQERCAMERYLPSIARILMAFIFVMSGINKIMD